VSRLCKLDFTLGSFTATCDVENSSFGQSCMQSLGQSQKRIMVQWDVEESGKKFGAVPK
jgi:hypothetical protein